MMRREDYLVWLLIFSTNLMAGAQSAGSLDVQVKPVADDHSCVNVSWEPADEAQYTVNCNGTDAVEQEPAQTASSQRVCRNYQPYSLVQCTVTASPGGSENGSGRTACAKPSKPTFNVSNKVTRVVESDDRTVRRRTIVVSNVKVDNINCGFISRVNVEVKRRSDNTFVDASTKVGLDESHEIDNLDAVTEYRAVVRVMNNGSDNNNNFMTAEKITTTGELPPGPVGNLRSSGSSPKCVDLTWSAPAEPRGTITSYTVNCTVDGQQFVRETATGLQITICQFSGYQLVNCSVGAKNEFYGTPTLTSTRTKCNRPSLPQFQLSQNLSADGKRQQISVNQITIEPNCESLQQIIIRLYKESKEIISRYPSDLTRPSATFSTLHAVTNYTVKVIVVNNEGQTSENSKSISTGELAPGGPPDEFKLNFNSSCVILDWREPLKPNGIILNYMVLCQDQRKTLPANVVRHTFCGFKPATRVNCSISANNSIGWSPPAMSSGYTAPKPMEAPQPAEITPKYEVLEAKIKTVSFTNETLKVQHYQFVVESVGSTTRKKREVSAVDVHQLFNEQTAATKGLNYYVAARISDQTGETIEFTTGDNEKYGNKDLERGVQYKIHYTYTVKLGDQDETYLVESPTSYELGPFPTHWIVIIIIVILIAIIVTVLVVLYKRNVISFKWIETQGKTGEEINGEEIISLTTPESSSQEKYAPVAAEESSVSVPMRDYEAKIKFCKEALRRSIQHDEDRRENEFEDLKNPKSYGDAIRVAKLPENSGKNRYKHIYPLDKHRVVLKDNPGGTDYINASHLPGFDKKDKFIAAMGPTDRSLNDFWWMLWQIKVETVVMLCRCVEEGKHKCAHYWPEVGRSEKYGPLTVVNYTEDLWAHFAIRTFKIRHEGGGTHRMMHYQYTSWPDHEVPKRTAPFVMFYEMIKHREKRLASKVPIVVHCSAGVGRTGTFIAVDYLVEQGEKKNMLDFHKCVSLLRERRPAMVQTPIQYHFLHWALLDILENNQFQTDVSMLPTKIHQARTSSAQSVLVEEYRTIEDQLKNVDLRFTDFDTDLIRSLKNPDHTVLADEESRIYLQDTGEDESDYINAISACSYKNIGKFIVAQNPISSTLRDFWVMIHEQKVTNILQLDSRQLSHIPTDNGTISVNGYEIRHASTKIKGNIEFIKLHMTPAHSKRKDYEEITVYKYPDWKHESTPPSEPSIIDLYIAVSLSNSPYNNNPLVITCRKTGEEINEDESISRTTPENSSQEEDAPVAAEESLVSVPMREASGDYGAKIKFCKEPLRRSIQHDEDRRENEVETIENQLKNVDLHFTDVDTDLIRSLKNPDPTVLADEESRIYLQDTGYDESDYINAISVCSYKNIGKFIVAQNPILSTLRDFWVMIHEQKVTNIVQLDSNQLSHIPTDNGTISANGYKIRHESTKIKGNIEYIKLHMTPAHSKRKNYEEITVYKYLDWKHESTPPSEPSIIDLYKAVSLSNSPYINNPLVITCRNGATKSGLFLNVYSILEKIEIEQVVDIYRSVQLTRLIRPHFINKLEDYIYLYEVVKTYTDRFATYSNFEPPSLNQSPGPNAGLLA